MIRVLALLLVMSGPVLAAETITGIAHGIDGDTIRVGEQPVRLRGVAAPELREAGGPQAQAFVRNMVNGRSASCIVMHEMSYQRRIGFCQVDGRDVGAAVIAAGLARDCPRYSRGRYAPVEKPEAVFLPLPNYCVPRKR